MRDEAQRLFQDHWYPGRRFRPGRMHIRWTTKIQLQETRHRRRPAAKFRAIRAGTETCIHRIVIFTQDHPWSTGTDRFRRLHRLRRSFHASVSRPDGRKRMFVVMIKYIAPICIVLILISSILDVMGIVKI